MEEKQKKNVGIIIGIIAFILIIGVGVACFFIFFNEEEIVVENNTVVVENNTEDPEETAAKIIITTSKKENKNRRVNINLNIPVITNLSNKVFQRNLNNEMATNITDSEKEIIIMAEGDESEIDLYTFTTTFETYASNKYLSIVINESQQTGGIRSNVWKAIYNIDVNNAKRIYLLDIFTANSDYETAIAEEVNRQAKEKNIELVGGNGLENIPEKQRFYIKDEKLFIYFDPAEIAPYVFGELHFEMPFVFENGLFSI